MKLSVAFLFLLASCFLLAYAIPIETISLWEGSLCYSMGLAGERRLPGMQEESAVITSTIPAFLPEESSPSIFGVEEGCFTYSFVGEQKELLTSAIAQKVPVNGAIDYRGFAFTDRLPALSAPLSDEELCYVFAAIVESATLSVPIKGRLEYISMTKKGVSLSAEAKILLDLTDLIRSRRLYWLPESADFTITMAFELKNSEISVIYDKISVRCDNFEIPESLLVFGCNVAFGKKDYRGLFGTAVTNVFTNARIYG